MSTNPWMITDLPLEIQFQIISHLPYPDVLALGLTSQHFHALTGPSLTVVSRVTWLLDRAQANLPIPKDGKLQLLNDTVFLRNREIQRILGARRRHEECEQAWRHLSVGEKWSGCLVVPGPRLCERLEEVLKKESRNRRTRLGQATGGMLLRSRDRLLVEVTRAVEAWRTSWTIRALFLNILLGLWVLIIAMRLAYGNAVGDGKQCSMASGSQFICQ